MNKLVMSDHGRGLGRASALFGKKIHEVQTPTTGTKSCHSCMTVSYLQFQTEFDQLPVSASAMVVIIIFSVISCGVVAIYLGFPRFYL